MAVDLAVAPHLMHCVVQRQCGWGPLPVVAGGAGVGPAWITMLCKQPCRGSTGSSSMGGAGGLRILRAHMALQTLGRCLRARRGGALAAAWVCTAAIMEVAGAVWVLVVVVRKACWDVCTPVTMWVTAVVWVLVAVVLSTCWDVCTPVTT